MNRVSYVSCTSHLMHFICHPAPPHFLTYTSPLMETPTIISCSLTPLLTLHNLGLSQRLIPGEEDSAIPSPEFMFPMEPLHPGTQHFPKNTRLQRAG
ncbi:hypothetical protein E2C01_020447 [Portunus trituberculatus]|uniref:Uncharacterized protein n=1 Tax=Portunus trituberculatus TaxID=210409 RepID=A0A5B7E1I7_PORTR|nr:hypothetical protein [Portunus trituberculatus]